MVTNNPKWKPKPSLEEAIAIEAAKEKVPPKVTKFGTDECKKMRSNYCIKCRKKGCGRIKIPF